jgi:hypothetical protein
MQHRQPRLVGRVETPRGDPRERAACGLLAVLTIDVEQLRHHRRRLGHRRTAHPAKPVGQTVPDAGQAFGAKPGDRLEPPIMRGGFQIGERLDPKLLVQAIGEYPADTGHGGEERDRVRFAPQPVEHGEPAVGQEFADGARDALAHTGQRLKAVESLLPEDLIERFPHYPHRCGGAQIGPNAIRIGSLVAEEARHLLEPAGDLFVDASHSPSQALQTMVRDDRRTIESAPTASRLTWSLACGAPRHRAASGAGGSLAAGDRDGRC